MNEFDENEFLDLCDRSGGRPGTPGAPETTDMVIRYDGCDFYNTVEDKVATDRRGEVVFCVIRPNGSILTVTCREYPPGTYRIPTGGVNKGEDVMEALFRETKEELGLDVEVVKFAGVLKIRFECGSRSEMFYSYIFIVRETGGRLLEDATDDEISGVREVGPEGLREMALSLLALEGRWKDWGKFRHATTDAVYRYLTE